MLHSQPISLPDYMLAGRIAAYIRKGNQRNNRQLFSIPVLARRFAVSETRLKNVFRKRYRQSIHRFVMAERISFIGELLQHSDLSVKAIAMMAGYTELSNCSRDFTKLVGISPKTYREKYTAPSARMGQS